MGIDTQTMEQTFAQYGRTIYRLALQYTRQPPDAEDVLQEVLLERCRRTKPFQSPEHERRWLLRVAVNKSRNLLRAGRRRPTVPLDEALAEYTPAEPSYRALYEAVLSLPRDYRLTVDLYYYEGYSTRGDRGPAGGQGGHGTHLAAPGQAEIKRAVKGGMGR